MKILDRIILFFAVVCMLPLNVFAAKDSDIYQSEIVSDINDTETYVKVISSGDTEQYTGKLSDYDNGRWENTDLSDIELFAVSEDDGDTYIIPVENQADIQLDDSKPDEDIVNDKLTTSSSVSSQDADIKCDVELIYGDSYSERVIIKDKKLDIPIKITNDGNEKKTVICYIGEYNAEGVLVDKIAGPAVPVDTGSVVETEIIKTINSEAETMKIFIWDSENLRPVTKAISLTEHNEDHYADELADAQVYDMSRYINGSIDTDTDVDIIKFVPESSGTYTINCISTCGITTALYNRNRYALQTDSSSYKYKLTGGQEYYLKMYDSSGGTGKYILSVQYDTAPEADNFSIYDFDIDTNVYKRSVLNMCEDLYDNDPENSVQMYNEYEAILKEEKRLHELPYILSDHPKELDNFDAIVNLYYSTKYDRLTEVRQKYIDLIDKYTDAGFDGENGFSVNSVNTDNTAEDKHPIARGYYPGSYSTEGIENNDEAVEMSVAEQAHTPSLTITQTTSTSITYSVTFPVSGVKGNAVYLVDFNNSNGLTTEYNINGRDSIYKRDGSGTITGLQPGGIYIVVMLWSTDGGENYGGENSISRFVQLPCDTSETLQMYDNNGRVAAYIEPEDKALASERDFNTWLERMDKTYSALRELTGYTPYNAQKIIMRSTRDNLNELFGDVDGENYWWVTFGYYDNTRIFKHSKAFEQGHMRRLSMGDWGFTPMHELSHTFDNDNWTFDAETLAQFKSYYVCEQLNAKIYEPGRFNNSSEGWYTGSNFYNLLKTDRYLDSYANSFDKGKYASEGFAAILIEIQKKIGWEPFKKTFRYFADLSYEQVPEYDGEKLNLFITKLKDYSGKDVLSYILPKDREIISDHYGIELDYTTAVIPVSGIGESAVITADKGSDAIYKFTPITSGNYYIYTSPYAESGISNDTYIDIYADAAMNESVASNDDHDGSRFSKVNIAMTAGTTYYIKVHHYKNGQLLSQIHITKDIPIKTLAVDEHDDIAVSNGEYAMYKFEPETSGAYVFDVSGYNGGESGYNTYIKLYENERMTELIGNDSKKIIANLKAGKTYYLQFCGWFMSYAKGRISIKHGQTLEFKKRTDSSFIYVNSPEYITKFDMVDNTTQDPLTGNLVKRKVFEQENVSGKNTYYETHLAWWDANSGNESYNPSQNFYMDVDFYNPTDKTVTVEIENIAYGQEYEVIQDYYNGKGQSVLLTLSPGEHKLLYENLNEQFYITDKGNHLTGWKRARIIVNMFDFAVRGGNITISSVAAYNRNNLFFAYGQKNKLSNGNSIDSGEVITDGSRPNESDILSKYKGYAKNEGWIDADIEICIDENTDLGNYQPIYLKDDYYTYGINNPKWSWISSLNPLNDDTIGELFCLSGGLHNFKYHHNNSRQWYFDFMHRTAEYINSDTSINASVNESVPEYIIDAAKHDMASGVKINFGAKQSPDPCSLSMGEWGATYHYTITVTNTLDFDCVLNWETAKAENMIAGWKMPEDVYYNTTYYDIISPDKTGNRNIAELIIPKNSTKQIEVVTTLGGGNGGITNLLLVDRKY